MSKLSKSERGRQNKVIKTRFVAGEFMVGIVLKEQQVQERLPNVHQNTDVTLTHPVGLMVLILQWLMIRSPGQFASTGSQTAATGQVPSKW